MGEYPRLLPVRQRLYSSPIQDLPGAVRDALKQAVPVGKALIVTTEKGAAALQLEGAQEKNAELLKAPLGAQPGRFP